MLAGTMGVAPEVLGAGVGVITASRLGVDPLTGAQIGMFGSGLLRLGGAGVRAGRDMVRRGKVSHAEMEANGVKIRETEGHTVFRDGDGNHWLCSKTCTPKAISTLEERINATPAGQFGAAEQSSRGSWAGQRGRSMFVPADISENAEVIRILKQHGVSGASYRVGKVNLTPFAEGTITTSKMSSSRRGNFRIADELLGRQWGKSREAMEAYRIQNNLTWHELNDLRTMELVPTAVNKFFGHFGGIAEAKLLGL